MYKINRTRLVLLVLCLIILPISSKCFYDFFDKINEESNNFVWQTNKRYSSLKLCLDCLLQLQFCVVLKHELRANLGLIRGDNGGHLAAGVNFINVLWAAFAPVDPKSVKRYWQLDWILTLLGATGVKAVRKYVGEIEPWFTVAPRFWITGLHSIFYRVCLSQI